MVRKEGEKGNGARNRGCYTDKLWIGVASDKMGRFGRFGLGAGASCAEGTSTWCGQVPSGTAQNRSKGTRVAIFCPNGNGVDRSLVGWRFLSRAQTSGMVVGWMVGSWSLGANRAGGRLTNYRYLQKALLVQIPLSDPRITPPQLLHRVPESEGETVKRSPRDFKSCQKLALGCVQIHYLYSMSNTDTQLSACVSSYSSFPLPDSPPRWCVSAS
jgi:hypothetical protein